MKLNKIQQATTTIVQAGKKITKNHASAKNITKTYTGDMRDCFYLGNLPRTMQPTSNLQKIKNFFTKIFNK